MAGPLPDVKLNRGSANVETDQSRQFLPRLGQGGEQKCNLRKRKSFYENLFGFLPENTLAVCSIVCEGARSEIRRRARNELLLMSFFTVFLPSCYNGRQNWKILASSGWVERVVYHAHSILPFNFLSGFLTWWFSEFSHLGSRGW